MSVHRKKNQRTLINHKSIKSLITKIQNKFNKNCEYWRNCTLFDHESYRCSNSGGSYCGKYRNYKVESSKKIDIIIK